MKRDIIWAGKSDIGKLSSNNEDAFVVQNLWDQNHVLALVIDGVGGYEGGEVAADIAKHSVVEYLSRYSNGERHELLKQAVIYANNQIFEERKRRENVCNMSCVMTAALVEVSQRRINMVHVGDTRLYQYSNGQLTKLSHDHSLVGYREEIGELTEEEAMQHPQRNIIGRDVGSSYLENGDTDYVEVATFLLEPHSTLMLCSDGLCDMITSKQMKAVLSQSISVEEKVSALINGANDAGGKDNVTVVLVENFLEKEENPVVLSEPKRIHKEERAQFYEPALPFVVENREKGKCQKKQLPRKTRIFVISLLVAALFVGGVVGWCLASIHWNSKTEIDMEKRRVEIQPPMPITRQRSVLQQNEASIQEKIEEKLSCQTGSCSLSEDGEEPEEDAAAVR
ncbi:MAG: protein phosphatase 2C domain-containing protein [Bacteroides sp.]|nr:protein phosphatase 2C domain-containing protein [Bacteroides sp.]